MTSWIELLKNPEAIDSLYDRPPSLAEFSLSEISWERDKQACMIRGTLARFPDFPRSNWEEDANRVGLRLWLEELDEFAIEGWSFNNVVDIEIDPVEGGAKYLVVAQGDKLSFRATCEALRVGDIFAYHSLQVQPAN